MNFLSSLENLLTFVRFRNVLEELSIRADIALSQKKVFQDIADGDNEVFDREYHALSAQVVCCAYAFCLALLNHGTNSIPFFSQNFIRIKLLSKLLLRLSKQGNWNEHWI